MDNSLEERGILLRHKEGGRGASGDRVGLGQLLRENNSTIMTKCGDHLRLLKTEIASGQRPQSHSRVVDTSFLWADIVPSAGFLDLSPA